MNRMNIIYRFIILGVLTLSHDLNSQNIIQDIKKAYTNLDKTTYIKNAIARSYTEPYPNYSNGYQISKDDIDSILHKSRNDEIVLALNIEIDTAKDNDHKYIKLDSNMYKFNVYYFDRKRRTLQRYLSFKNNMNYPYFSPTCGTIYQRDVVNGYLKVLRRRPDFILNCYQSYFNIFYVHDKRIYVYNVVDKKTYEFDNFIKEIW